MLKTDDPLDDDNYDDMPGLCDKEVGCHDEYDILVLIYVLQRVEGKQLYDGQTSILHLCCDRVAIKAVKNC